MPYRSLKPTLRHIWKPVKYGSRETAQRQDPVLTLDSDAPTLLLLLLLHPRLPTTLAIQHRL